MENPLVFIRYLLQRQNARKTRTWADIGNYHTATAAIEDGKELGTKNGALRVVRVTTEILWHEDQAT